MTVDTSALIAILFAEPNHMDLIDLMLGAEQLRIGAPTLVETSLVFASRSRRHAGTTVGDLIQELDVSVVPFGEAEWREAARAFARYGRGRHKAGLNFGDCLAYASATVAGDSLLFVGDDFRKTDIRAAIPLPE